MTVSAVNRFALAIKDSGHQVELADLVAERFDPVLRGDDEPDWNDPKKLYSQAVWSEMHRIERNDAMAVIFPIWWWSMPAVLKGWIDRVWNYGWAYGARKFPLRRVWMIGIAGDDFQLFQTRGYDQAISTQLIVGILDYCGVEEARVELLYGALKGGEQVESTMDTDLYGRTHDLQRTSPTRH